MSFADQLRPLVERVGGPVPAAEICGVTERTIRLWLRSEGNPNAATQAGALLLLGRAKHPTRH